MPIYVVLSLVLHAALVTFWVLYRPTVAVPAAPQVRFVEFVQPPPQVPMQQQAQARTAIEAPGAETSRAVRPDAYLGSANRKAATPNPRGDRPTLTPGDGRNRIDAPARRGGPAQPPTPGAAQQVREAARAENDSRFEYRVASAAPLGDVDWRTAIRDAAKGAASGSSVDGGVGGDEGFAESGPVSFETQWYEWGDYGDAMVRKIRRHWYANMPNIVRMGVKGVVTIRFTIQRSGEITDITVVSTSTVPPFDFAARKAIELSSSLQPLPADFPGQSERVTASFYYNMKVPDRR